MTSQNHTRELEMSSFHISKYDTILGKSGPDTWKGRKFFADVDQVMMDLHNCGIFNFRINFTLC